MFKIPKIAWIILALWLVVNIAALLSIGISGQALGHLVGRIMFPGLLAWLLTIPVWFLSRRSQKAASITFVILLILMILSFAVQNIPKA